MLRRRTGSAATALVGVAAVAVLVTGAGYAALHGPIVTSHAPVSAPSDQVRAGAGAESGTLLPGGSVGGTLFLRNAGPVPVELPALELGPATTAAPGCDPAAVAFALLTAPTPQAPLLVPGRSGGQEGTSVLGYTAFLSAEAEPACRGARFRSELVAVDRTGRTVVLGAARATGALLPAPAAPVASRTTATTAELTWLPSYRLPPGASWIVERTTPGAGSAWTAACRSAASPLIRTACTDSGLTPGADYTYRVVAVVGRWRASSRAGAPVRTGSAAG